jgi:hypothetical protein
MFEALLVGTVATFLGVLAGWAYSGFALPNRRHSAQPRMIHESDAPKVSERVPAAA